MDTAAHSSRQRLARAARYFLGGLGVFKGICRVGGRIEWGLHAGKLCKSKLWRDEFSREDKGTSLNGEIAIARTRFIQYFGA